MTDQTPASRILLIGYRGTGKTTVANHLAAQTGNPWIDIDAEIVRCAECTVKEIFDNEGEEGFRRRETVALKEVLAHPYPIIACGGGIVIREENRQLLATSGKCVWLRATSQTICGRLENDSRSSIQRPPLTELGRAEEISQLLEQREPLYTRCADLVIDTDEKSTEQVAMEILGQISIHSPPPH